MPFELELFIEILLIVNRRSNEDFTSFKGNKTAYEFIMSDFFLGLWRPSGSHNFSIKCFNRIQLKTSIF